MLADELPEKRNWGFIKYATYRLCDWHEFRYENKWKKEIDRFITKTLKENIPNFVKL
ncbi:MAG: hypothetical protein N2323_04900 [candidate division WOR-3 bacterium]|nr:hypothetical protein [candidate division WOR-3 bacterium]